MAPRKSDFAYYLADRERDWCSVAANTVAQLIIPKVDDPEADIKLAKILCDDETGQAKELRCYVKRRDGMYRETTRKWLSRSSKMTFGRLVPADQLPDYFTGLPLASPSLTDEAR